MSQLSARETLRAMLVDLLTEYGYSVNYSILGYKPVQVIVGEVEKGGEYKALKAIQLIDKRVRAYLNAAP